MSNAAGRFDVMFHFERGAVTLPTGAIFRPARNAVDRWVVEQPAAYQAVGTHYHCLYQTADDRFVYVDMLKAPPYYGSTEEVTESRLVSDDEARRFLLDQNFDLPDCLAEGLIGFPDVGAADDGPGEGARTPAAVADGLEGLIESAKDWMEPRPRVLSLGEPYPEKYREEDKRIKRVRRDIEKTGKRLASALVQHNESAGPLLSLLNWVAEDDTVAARKGWSAVKVALQETAIRLRLHDDTDATPSPATSSPANADASPADSDTTDDERQTPALTEPQRITLGAMKGFDPSMLVSAAKISDAIEPAQRISEETVRQAVIKLIALDLAERPEGDRRGARLTIKGRRLAGKIAD